MVGVVWRHNFQSTLPFDDPSQFGWNRPRGFRREDFSKFTGWMMDARSGQWLTWLGWQLWNICVTNDHGYVPLVVNTSRSFPHSWLITRFVTRLTWRMPLVEQELSPFRSTWVHPRFLMGFNHVTLSLVLCVCFVDRCLSFLYFLFWPLCCLFFLDLWILITSL